MPFSSDTVSFPIDAYLQRLGFQGSPALDEQTLVSLHRAHVFTLPFENLTPWTGSPVCISQEALLQKMVLPGNQGRGGYCFELNQLFLLALRALGFKTRPLSARVWRFNSYGPRSHQITLVEIQGRKFLADVGFGGNGLIESIPFEPDSESKQFLDHYRIKEDEEYGFRLESRVHDQWRTLYAFSLDLFTEEDFSAMNYFVSTSPASYFTQVLMCMRPSETDRSILYGNTFKIRDAKGSRQETVSSSAALRVLLRDRFGLDWPAEKWLREPLAVPPGSRQIE